MMIQTKNGIFYSPSSITEAHQILAANHGKRMDILVFHGADNHLISDVYARPSVDGLGVVCRKYRGRNWWHAASLESVFTIRVRA